MVARGRPSPSVSSVSATSASSHGSTTRVGEVVQDRYRLVRIIGAGGFGTVWEARHLEMGTGVALKILHPDHSRDPRAVKRFELEASRSAALRHPNTIRVFDFGHTDGGELFIAMELLDGRSLEHALAHEPPLGPQQVVHILSQILRALDEAHLGGLVHRDLKPGNVFLLAIGRERDFVKVLDFGIAKAVRDDAGLTSAGTLIGTPLYMSPEQCRGRELDGRSDLYSLGCMAFEMLTGRPPFEASDALGYAVAHLQEEPPDPRTVAGPERPVPEGLARWVLRLLAKDPSDRYPDAAAALDALGAALAGQATWEFKAPAVSADPQASATSITPKGSRPSERETNKQGGPRARRRWLWPSLAALVISGATIAALAWPRSPQTTASAPPHTTADTTASATGASGESAGLSGWTRDALADDAALMALLRFVPPDAGMVVAVRRAGLSGSPALAGVYTQLCDTMFAKTPLGAFGAPAVLDDATELVFAITTDPWASGDPEYVVALATPDPGRVREPAFDANATFEAEPFPWIALTSGAGLVFEPRRLAVASPGATRAMVAARAGTSVLPDSTLAPMLERVGGGSPLFVVVKLPPLVRAELDGELPGAGRASLIGVRVTIGDGASLRAYLDFPDATIAREVHTELARRLTKLRTPDPARPMSVHELGLLAHLTTSVDGTRIVFDAHFAEAELARMVEFGILGGPQ